MNRMWDNILVPIIRKINSKCIVEIGSGTGINTKNILNYCVECDAKLISIDPNPNFDVSGFSEEYSNFFTFYEELSLERLPLLENFDCVLIDGDHNWYTVYHELISIYEKFSNNNFPLIFLHDISWPYGRRDLYYNPKNIPAEYLNEYSKLGIILDNEELVTEGGINYNFFNANKENTPKNGVLTAIEDFLEFCPYDLDFHSFPIFYGLGIIHKKDLKLYDFIEKIIYSYQTMEFIEKEYISEKILRDEKLTVLNKKLIDYIENNEELNNLISIREKRINSLVNENNFLLDKSSSLSERIEGLLSQNNTLMEDSLSKSNQNEKLLIENHQLFKESIEKDNIISNLNENLNNFQSSVNHNEILIDSLNSELEETKQKLLFKTDKLNHFKSEVNLLNKRNYQLNETKQDQFNEIIFLKSSNDGLKELVDRLTTEVVNKNNIILENEKSINNLNEKISHFKEEISLSSKELNKSLHNLNLMTERNHSLTKTKKSQFDEKLKSLNDNLMNNINDLKNRNDELNKLLVVAANDYEELTKLLQDNIHNKYVLEQENFYLKNSNYLLKIKLDELLKSNSWKATSIFRKIRKFFKFNGHMGDINE